MKTIQQIEEQLSVMASSAAKESIERFVPHSQKVYGVKMPLLNELCKELKDGGFPLVYALWKNGAFEEKMLAAKLIGKLSKKQPWEALEAVEKFSASIKDWAICDTLGMQSLKPIAATHQNEIFSLAKKLNRSDNFWQRRLSLVLVEVFAKDVKLHPAIHNLIDHLKTDKEYYVKKAITWLNKSMQKRNSK